MTAVAVSLCTLLGVASLLLNAFVIVALLRNRRRVLTNVFYVIVLHCAFLDVLRGFCLIGSSFPYLIINKLSFTERFQLLRAQQYMLITLRTCNMLTIFNLLVFTSNEYIVISYPLHYKRYLRRRVIMAVLLICWMVCVVFGVGTTFSTPQRGAVEWRNGTLHKIDKENEEIDVGTFSLVAIFVLCYICLIIVVWCYIAILRTIRKFQSSDKMFNSDDSHRIHNRSSYKAVSTTANGVCPKGCGTDHPLNKRSASLIILKRCTSLNSKWRQVRARNKYIVVIGTVLLVDTLFLIPYSGIQMVALLHLNNMIATWNASAAFRWTMQIIIGVHSVCQPLCYFRMNEFRRLACCGQAERRRGWTSSRSISQAAQAIRSATRTRDCCEEETVMDSRAHSPVQPLLNAGAENGAINALLEKCKFPRQESVRFRKYRQTDGDAGSLTIELSQFHTPETTSPLIARNGGPNGSAVEEETAAE